MLRSNTHGGHVLLLMASQNLNTRKVLIILTMQVIDTLERECGISPDVIKNNLDKTHPIGPPDKYGKQLRIVTFTTDSFKETVFRKHKHRRNLYIEGKNVVVSRSRLR